MTGPQGMGPLVPGGGVPGFPGGDPHSQYDDDMYEVLNGIFYLKPLVNHTTYSAWETFQEAVDGNIALTSNRGPIYFRAWTNESGWAATDYDDLLADHEEFDAFFEIFPSSFSTYSAWETRSYAYSTDMALTSQKGPIYFKAWFAESGEGGTYEDIINDSQQGNIFKIEAVIT